MLATYYCKNSKPKEALFKCQGFAKDWMLPKRGCEEHIPMDKIPPFLRTLLVTDGTVTKSLEAYFWEPVSVHAVEQNIQEAEYDLPWLNVTHGEEVMPREVKLQGDNTEKVYATAFSVIRPQIIPEFFRHKLLNGEIGIGVLIRDSGLESYREILEFGSEKYPSILYNLDGTNTAETIDIIYRTYRIHLGGKPAILITERFPLTLFS